MDEVVVVVAVMAVEIEEVIGAAIEVVIGEAIEEVMAVVVIAEEAMVVVVAVDTLDRTMIVVIPGLINLIFVFLLVKLFI